MAQEIKKGQTAKKKILVGMTGRIDSTVAAYLLKKQGFEVIGIGILFSEVQELKKDPKTQELTCPFGVQFINDLNRVKGVCDELEIPFYGVHAEERYRTSVEEFLVAARLGGTTFSPLVFSTRVILQILVEKMFALGADGVATGNYGKVTVNMKNGDIGIGQSNDLANDETFQLARVSPTDASYLQLPLSEMRRKEVLKVYVSLNLKNCVTDSEIKGDKVNEILLMQDPRIEDVVVKNSSKDLIRKGSIIDYTEDTVICDHDGIHKYYVGQSKVKGKGPASVDQKMQVIRINPKTGDIFVALPDELRFSFCELKDFSSGKSNDEAKPMDAHVKLRPDLLKVPCDIYLGNNNSAFIEFKQEQAGQLVNGQFVVIYDREGEGARVIGAGIVNRSGFITTEGERRELPLSNAEKSELDPDDEKQQPSKKISFRF